MTYLMEHKDEEARLEIKTDPEVVKRQAAWAGIKPGMRVLDVGCGIGKTTAALAELVGPAGQVVGLDYSAKRLALAQERYGSDRIRFIHHDIRTPFHSSPPFDAVWARFILEYFRHDQLAIVGNITASLGLGGIACLVDSDCNSLLHHGQDERLQKTLEDIMGRLARDHDFDAYAGRRLFGHLRSLGFHDISCRIEPHHLIYGELSTVDAYNWTRKIEQSARVSGCTFDEYAGEEFSRYPSRYDAFVAECTRFFTSPERFSYTPLVICRGLKTPQLVR
ncbi:MAG: methyltransferase domain-containing protein [Desulfuromonadales bacterium]|nr:methyltransferase domain-containing protein [Desulfuromonadales bacterium]